MAGLTVGLNLTWLVPGVVGGSEDATVGAIVAAVDLAADRDMRLVGIGSADLAAAHPSLAGSIEWVTVPWATGSRVQRVIGDNRRLGDIASAAGVELLHHGGGVVPPALQWTGPQTLTIHDVQPLDLPGNFSFAKRTYIRGVLGRSARGATRIAVPSQFVAERVVETCRVSASHISVVPWSAPIPPAPVTAEMSRSICQLHGIGSSYVLYPAITHPHKNHHLLIEAMAVLDPGVELVLCGGEGSAERAVINAIAASPAASRIHRLGRVSRNDLEAFYAGAAAVAVPSRYEGFGLPALEAMVRGVPLAASSAGSLVEVAGELAHLSPDEPAAWGHRLNELVSNAEARAAAVALGASHAAQFTPERSAADLVDLWSDAARGLRSAGSL